MAGAARWQRVILAICEITAARTPRNAFGDGGQPKRKGQFRRSISRATCHHPGDRAFGGLHDAQEKPHDRGRVSENPSAPPRTSRQLRPRHLIYIFLAAPIRRNQETRNQASSSPQQAQPPVFETAGASPRKKAATRRAEPSPRSGFPQNPGQARGLSNRPTLVSRKNIPQVPRTSSITTLKSLGHGARKLRSEAPPTRPLDRLIRSIAHWVRPDVLG